MGASNSMEEMKIRIQSLITPATFIVNAEVLPINKYTDTLSAKASVALLSSTAGSVDVVGEHRVTPKTRTGR